MSMRLTSNVLMVAAVAVGCKASRGGMELQEAAHGGGGHHDIYADQSAWSGSCGKGLDASHPTQRQSPIALDPAVFAKARTGGITLNYGEADARLVDNGHTIQVAFPNSQQSLSFEGHNYTLQQFHFHRYSEHVIAAEGSPERRYAMEVHFVHTRPALGPDDKSVAVALGFFIEEGRENAELERIWSHLPNDLESGDTWPIAVERMIPRGAEYLVYEGSLTTPPCDEIVIHAVSTTPMTMSAEQMERFTKLYARNSRALQPVGEAEVRNFRVSRETGH